MHKLTTSTHIPMAELLNYGIFSFYARAVTN